MTESTRDFEPYFRDGSRFCTHEEFREILREAGSPDALLKRHRALSELLERDRQRMAVWRFLIRAAAVFAALVTFLGAIKMLLPIGWLW